MNVAVDETWKDGLISEVDYFNIGRRVANLTDVNDYAVFDRELSIVLRCTACAVDQAADADDLQRASP